MEQNEQTAYEIPVDTPEFYVDSVHIQTQLYGSTLLLGELREGAPPVVKVKVKVSPQMAKVLSLIGRLSELRQTGQGKSADGEGAQSDTEHARSGVRARRWGDR